MNIKPEIRAGLLNDYRMAPQNDVTRLLIALLENGPSKRRKKKLLGASVKIARVAARPQQIYMGVLILEGMAASAEAAGKHQAARAARDRRSQIDVGVISLVIRDASEAERALEVCDSIYCLVGYVLLELMFNENPSPTEADVERACAKLWGEYCEIVGFIDQACAKREHDAPPATWLGLLAAQEDETSGGMN